MCGSGSRTVIILTTTGRPPTARRGQQEIAVAECFAAVPGARNHGASARPAASGPHPVAGTAAWASGSGERSYLLEPCYSLSQTKRHRQSRRFDDLLARGRQPGQRQNRLRFARRRVQRRFLEPEVELATAAVAWERRGRRLAFRTVCRTGDLDMKMLGVTIPGTHLVKPSVISSGLAAQRLLDRGID